MSAWLFESSPYDDGIVATIWADTDADLPGVNDFGEPLKEMSICKIISNGRKYILDSTGTWKIQPISDLSQYGTRSWIIELLEQSTLGTAHQPNETLKSLNFHEDLGQEGVLLLDVFQPVQIGQKSDTLLFLALIEIIHKVFPNSARSTKN